MADEEKEKIDSQNDPSEDDENTDSEDEGSDDTSDDTEDDAADDKSDGDDSKDDEDKPKFTEREKKLYARAKNAEAELKKLKGVKPEPAKPKADDSVDVDSKVQAALDKRDLDALDLPDEVKTEIKNYAKLHKVSVLAAAKAPYIQFVKDQADKKARAEEAATGTKRKSQPKSNFTDAKPEDFDLSTEQGRKDWEAYRNWLKTQ